MKILKRLLKIALGLILLLGIAAFIYIQQHKPTYKGEVKLPVAKKVEVYFDSIGVPHIYADNQKDAYKTLGYVHAQDRLWQMELMRRISAGRLSEILGEKLIETDKFFITLGIDSKTDEIITKLDKNAPSYILAQAYLEGVNQFIDQGPTPVEFTLIGIDKEHYTMKDIYNVFGYMSFSFAMAHKTDPLLSKLQAKYGQSYMKDLGVTINPKSTTIPVFNPNENNVISKIETILEKVPVSSFIGSNAWVVGPEKTATGKVLFSNDPHMKYAQPGIWYQSHIVCPDFELYGFNLALTPFSLLGHNRTFAYGLTMFENDDVDFYAETPHPHNTNQYSVGGTSYTYNVSTKTIKVKGGETVSFEVKSTIHGPIMNVFIGYEDSKQPIAMDWIYTKFPNEMMSATYAISHAKSLKSFKNGVSKIVAPGLNVMYGDASNNIAWFAAAKLYHHKNKVNTKLILDGSNGLDDKLNYIDFKDNPQAINPPWHYVYSANNQPDVILDSLLYPGYYLPEDRAKRIVSLLDEKEKISISDIKKIVTDNTSSKASNLVKILSRYIDKNALSNNERSALEILESWKGDFELNKTAPTIYTKFKYLFFKNVFKDELGDDFEQFVETHLGKRQFAKQLELKSSIWYDNISTIEIEDKQHIIRTSFKQAIAQLETQFGQSIRYWTWHKAHTLEHGHAIGSQVSALRGFFNVGPFPVRGTNEVIDNQMFAPNEAGVYKVGGGPSTRRIIDFNDVEHSVAIIPTGQSGNVFSKHYKDQAEKFVNNEFYPMLLNKKDIQQQDDKLVITPLK